MAAKVLAAIYLGANETDRGLQMLQAAARLVPDDFRPWFAMGDSVFLRRRRYEEAAAAFRESLKRSPDHLESRVGLIGALTKAHHLDQAEPLLQAILRERPDDPSVLIHAAALALESDRRQDGARYLEQVLTLDPDHREALLLRARMQLGKHQPREALADAERALALAPNDLEALNLLGSIQTALGLKDRAAETLIRRRQVEQRTALIGELTLQIRRSPTDPELRWRLGDAAALAGMRPLAVQSYQAALALAPGCEQARHGLRKLEASSEIPGPFATRLDRPSPSPSP
jgi:tetratricopeptide (TPR) repeat protein